MIRLYMGGSPCTSWSIAKSSGREVEAKGIGWELFKNYVIGMEKYKPDYFLYENNKSMSRTIRDSIDGAFLDVYRKRDFGVQRTDVKGHNQTWYLLNPLTWEAMQLSRILINSGLVSAQNRQRYYWTNVPSVELPEDRGILLRDILETGVAWREKSYTLTTACCRAIPGETIKRNRHTMVAEPIRIGTIESTAKNSDHDSQQYRVYSPDGKSITLCGNGGGVGAKTGLYAAPLKQRDKNKPVHEVQGGKIKIRDEKYPINLDDGN